MCGIAGIVRFDGKPIETATLDAMQRAIRHRGPDGEGRYVTPNCALLHARLSIIDIAGGAQPMHVDADAKGGALTVVFNGEIYNHRELRAELVKLGHKFVTDHSDTEVLLHGYREWGSAILKKLHGMFALAIWDQLQGSLLLSRDLAGKKPLFYRRLDDDGGFAFASVPVVLLGSVPASMNPGETHRYLALGYPKNSVVSAIEEVPPGHFATVVSGNMGMSRFFDHDCEDKPFQRVLASLVPPDEMGRAFLPIIAKSVEMRLEADVPLGCFLSGGIDSGIVAALANQALLKRGAEPLRTFTMGMPDADYDESEVAQRVAAKLGTRHTTLRADPSADLFKDLARLIELTGEPIADSSVLPTFWVCKAAREHVKVVLSGDGGDEAFGGYDRYRAMRLLESNSWWLKRVPMGSFGVGADGRSMRSRLRRLVAAAGTGDIAARYENMIRVFDDVLLSRLLPSLSHSRLVEFKKGPRSLRGSVWGAILWDRRNYLPCDVLRKVDRASMAAGLEVRCPLLDAELNSMLCEMRLDQFWPGGRPKGILRQIASKLVGSDIASLPKRGFGLPIGGWFATSLHEELRQRLMDGPLDTLGFQKPVIATMLEEHKSRSVDHTHRLFALLALSMWVESVPGVRMAETSR